MERKCKVCGKPVSWGEDGCPVRKIKDNETESEAAMSAFLGDIDYWEHYKCESNEV